MNLKLIRYKGFERILQRSFSVTTVEASISMPRIPEEKMIILIGVIGLILQILGLTFGLN